MSTYLIAAVIRQDGTIEPSAERLIERRITAATEIQARRLFLEQVWSRGLLCSYVAGVTRVEGGGVDREA